MSDDATTRDDARVVAARRLVRQADTIERLRGRGLLASVLASVSLVVMVVGAAPPALVVVPVACTLVSGFLLVRLSLARANYRRSVAASHVPSHPRRSENTQ